MEKDEAMQMLEMWKKRQLLGKAMALNPQQSTGELDDLLEEFS